jgi:glycerol kinase
MKQTAVLAIDQGTTNTKALLVAPDGRILASASKGMNVSYPKAGWAEQSATEIWDTVKTVIAELVDDNPETAISSIAISNQRETIVIWDAETGEPIAPAITWQCRRSNDLCANWRRQGFEYEVMVRSGLAIDPLFPSGKIKWLLDEIPDARIRAERGALKAGTIDSWLLWNLTAGAEHATDHSNASRTQLLNLDTLEWDAFLLETFDVPLAILPTVKSSDSCFGRTVAGATALPDGVPVQAMLGDSHAALFEHGIKQPGRAKVTIGTGSSVMTVTNGKKLSGNGLSSTIAWSQDGTAVYALEGNILVAGHAAAFATQLLGLKNEEDRTELALSEPSADGVCFVPALAGLGAPYWDAEARGVFDGLSLGTKPAHLARAALEAIAQQICDVVEAMDEDLGARLSELSVDGGVSRNATVMRMLAALSDRSIARMEIPEASALGAARMAYEAQGNGSIAFPPPDQYFAPRDDEKECTTSRVRWKKAISRARLNGGS